MQHPNNLTAAIDDFAKQLPDPKFSLDSTIIAEIKVKGRTTKVVAQKVKGLVGLTWKIDQVKADFFN
ncbi:MAG: hypothetical protein ACO1N7_02045 [Sphingobacteriaceae bacterium]